MIFEAAALAQLLQMCAPGVGVRTMTAIVRVESNGSSLAIHDNTLRRSLTPRNSREAAAWATQLIAMHHSVDLGLTQINNANLPRLGLSVPQAFDACSNASGGSTILAVDYRQAATQFGPGQFALRHAIGAYNSGSIFQGYAYIERILAAAGVSGPAVRVPDLQADVPASAPVFLAVSHSAQPSDGVLRGSAPVRLMLRSGGPSAGAGTVRPRAVHGGKPPEPRSANRLGSRTRGESPSTLLVSIRSSSAALIVNQHAQSATTALAGERGADAGILVTTQSKTFQPLIARAKDVP